MSIEDRPTTRSNNEVITANGDNWLKLSQFYSSSITSQEKSHEMMMQMFPLINQVEQIREGYLHLEKQISVTESKVLEAKRKQQEENEAFTKCTNELINHQARSYFFPKKKDK